MNEMLIRNGRGLKLYNTKKKNVSSISSALEKLSSGYKINRSADDAAGLAISEKLRLKITGLNRAVENSREGANMIQIGEGALQEIHDMLNRMADLAEQSANGTYSDVLDRESLQKELDQLRREVDRIAESTLFGDINLFQNKGYEFEYDAVAKSTVLSANSSAETKKIDLDTKPMTMRDVIDNTDPDGISIVYVEDEFTAVMTPSGEASGAGGSNDPIVGETGKRLSQILKEQIVPQCVSNILNTYTCFSYLKGSTLGIGLSLYNDASDSASASVRLTPYTFNNDGTIPDSSYLGFTLSVNVAKDVLGKINSTDPDVVQDARSKLEATIAHEMIHAFMDEATTAGMLGLNPDDMKQDMSRYRFPGWFIEGMANTASGPTGWVHKYASSGGLKITESSNDAEILSQIKTHPLNSDSAVNMYGTGYLACMYLGAKIGGYNGGSVNAATISKGLSSLLGAVIGGTSLDGAIKSLTGFNDTADFVSKFNAGTCPDMFEFARQMQAARGEGLGGIVSGNLAATDVAKDTDITTTLFQLNTADKMVMNYYPDGYVVGSGGSVSISGQAPSDYGTEYGDFIVTGDPSRVTYSDGTLTINGTGNFTIKMKDGTSSSADKIILTGGCTVTLDGIKTTGEVEIQSAAEIDTVSANEIGNLTLASSAEVTFGGSGQLKMARMTGDSTNRVTVNSGAVIVGNGTGTITIDADNITINNAASLAANLSGVTNYDVDWSKLTEMQTITSVTLDGGKTNLLLNNGDSGSLRIEGEASTVHSLTYEGTDGSGNTVTRTQFVQWDADSSVWKTVRPFEVKGGTEGTDYEYDPDGTTLIIKSSAAMTVTGGGKIVDAKGNSFYGRMVVNSGSTANLTLEDITIDAAKIGGDVAGIEIESGIDVTFTMKGTNTVTGSERAAGIQVAENTDEKTVTIDMTAGSSLDVKGGTIGVYGGAGIGAAWDVDASKSNLVITGSGTINAIGGNGGAGIGGSEGGFIGNITIDGGASDTLTINTLGGQHGAGIGAGGWVATCSNPYQQGAGDILIKGAVEITAGSAFHGTGIGSACHSSVGDVTIGEKGKDNSLIKINTTGGDDGAAIGAGWNGTVGNITIQGGTITATGGSNGAGIGTGKGATQTNGATITINGGTIIATGKTASSGIGNGNGGTVNSVTINGGTITAKGGWTNDGGNIGGYSDRSGNTFAPVTITNPEGSSIKAGKDGEGMYIAIGAKDADGNEIHAFSMAYLSELLKKDPSSVSSLTVSDDGTDRATLTYPLTKVKATLADGTVYEWDNLRHMSEDGAYIWIKAQDLTLEFEDQDGTKGTVSLSYFEEYGLWRVSDEEELPEKPEIPTPTPPPPPTPPDEPPDEPTPDNPPSPSQSHGGSGSAKTIKRKQALGAIVLQIGENSGETLTVPRFYFSATALKLDTVDISNQEKAWDTMETVRKAVNRVSDMRGTYGALSNRLEHNINNLTNAVIQDTETESQIRDADMAKEIFKYTKANILNETAQAMLAQGNQISEGVLRLLQ